MRLSVSTTVMTNLQAAVGVVQMERFEEIINKKREIFNFYNLNLLNLKGISKMPFNSNNLYNSCVVIHTYFRFFYR